MSHEVIHNWSVCCKKALIDSDSNILNLLEIVEKIDVDVDKSVDISLEARTAIPFEFVVVSYWRKLSTNKKVNQEARLILSSPDDIELLNHSIQFEIPSEKKAMRTISKLNMLPLVGSGTYNIEVQQKIGKKYVKVAELPIEIVIHRRDK